MIEGDGWKTWYSLDVIVSVRPLISHHWVLPEKYGMPEFNGGQGLGLWRVLRTK